MISVNPVQSEKASSPIVVSVPGRLTVFKEVALLNALSGIVLTPSGTVMLSSASQPEKMLLPADSQLFGKLMLLRFVQFSKAYDPIVVILSGKLSEVNPVHS